jgi:hypothetical protein
VQRSSSGVIRTRDLPIMSRTLSPAELRCPVENGGLVPVVVPPTTEKPGTSSITAISTRHYESGTPVSDCHSAGNVTASGRQRTPSIDGYASAAHGAKNPRCPCGETDPSKFGKRTNRGKVGWQPKCKSCAVEAHRQWRSKPAGHAKMRAGVAASRRRHPEKQRARAILNDAIRRGVVHKGACYAAGLECTAGIEGHHDDYSKPLEPTWTCRKHHRALDRARREKAQKFMDLVELVVPAPKKFRGTRRRSIVIQAPAAGPLWKAVGAGQ